ncbi:unnamed protein product [Arabis nemorensis]|uniref:Uncharacterized protein n=1 Tax=Arabis nemorensis TaxID=586526 RepID=A0A565BKR3_9BRAS|nr:unnamed protein product [Arabis nemorensis]
MLSPEQSPAPVPVPNSPIYIEISSDSAMSLEHADSQAPVESPIRMPPLPSQNQEQPQQPEYSTAEAIASWNQYWEPYLADLRNGTYCPPVIRDWLQP